MPHQRPLEVARMSPQSRFFVAGKSPIGGGERSETAIGRRKIAEVAEWREGRLTKISLLG
jgi:hypothetical protein